RDEMKLHISSPKLQRNSMLQTSNREAQARLTKPRKERGRYPHLAFGNGGLELIWCLVFGVLDFVHGTLWNFKFLWLVFGVWCLEFSAGAQTTNGTFPIDLPTALRLAGAQNLDVKIAQSRLAEAKANYTSALSQFFPWIAPGAAFRRHENQIQD